MAFEFNASGEWVYFSDTSLNVTTALTSVVWVNFSSVTGWNGNTVGKRTGAGDPGGTVAFSLYREGGEVGTWMNRTASTAEAVSTGGAVTTDTWYFVACTFSAANDRARIYLGGLRTDVALEDSDSGGSGNLDTNTGILWYGADQSDAGNQRIAFLAHFGKELSLEELQLIQYDPVRGSLVQGSNLLAMSFPGLHGTSNVPDLSGNGLTATIGGSPTLYDWVPLKHPFDDAGDLSISVAAATALTIDVNDALTTAEALD